MLGSTILTPSLSPANTPSPPSTPSKPYHYILILKLLLLPFYLFLWGWLLFILMLVLSNEKVDKHIYNYLFGDIVVCLELMVAPILLCDLMTSFYLQA